MLKVMCCLLMFISYDVHSKKFLSGKWSCKVTGNVPFKSYSVLKISDNIDSYERTSELKLTSASLDKTLIHQRTYEKGSISFKKNMLTFTPLEVDVERLKKGPKDEHDEAGHTLKSLSVKESLEVVNATASNFTMKMEGGILDQCKRPSEDAGRVFSKEETESRERIDSNEKIEYGYRVSESHKLFFDDMLDACKSHKIGKKIQIRITSKIDKFGYIENVSYSKNFNEGLEMCLFMELTGKASYPEHNFDSYQFSFTIDEI